MIFFYPGNDDPSSSSSKITNTAGPSSVNLSIQPDEELEYTVVNNEEQADEPSRDSEICDYFELEEEEKEFFDQMVEYEKIRLANIMELEKFESVNNIATATKKRFREIVGMKKIKTGIKRKKLLPELSAPSSKKISVMEKVVLQEDSLSEAVNEAELDSNPRESENILKLSAQDGMHDNDFVESSYSCFRTKDNGEVKDYSESYRSPSKNSVDSPFEKDRISVLPLDSPGPISPRTPNNGETPRTLARKRRDPLLTEKCREVGFKTPSKDTGKDPVNKALVNILVHFLAEKLNVDLQLKCPTESFWVRFIEEFGLEKGQGLIASTSSFYMRKIWRKNFTSNVNRAPHAPCLYCPTPNEDLGAPKLVSFKCPICSNDLSSWNSLR